MSHWISSRGISMPLAIAIIALGVIQITLQIWALVDVAKRRAPTQRKVVFTAVIILAGLVGAIAYLAVGRAMLDEEARAAGVGGEGEGEGEARDENARRRALDQLYGPDRRR